MFQPALHMPKRILIRHQIDQPLPAIRIQLADFLRGKRARILPHIAMIAIRERVLDVELKLIDLPTAEQIDQRFERRHRRNFVPAHIQHHPAHKMVRPVFDVEAGNAFAKLTPELAESPLGVTRSRVIVPNNLDLAA